MFAKKEKEHNMSYKKPELVVLPSAIQSVQGVGKENGTPLDIDHVQKTTKGAYEADE